MAQAVSTRFEIEPKIGWILLSLNLLVAVLGTLITAPASLASGARDFLANFSDMYIPSALIPGHLSSLAAGQMLDDGWMDIPAHEKPAFRAMGSHDSGAWEASIPDHVKPVREFG